jgi:hypothetical protein
VLVNNFPTFNPGDLKPGPFQRAGLTGFNYTNYWNNYVINASQTIPTLSPSSIISTLIGTCGVPTNTCSLSNLIVDVYLPDPEGQVNGAKFNEPEFGGTGGWGFVQGTNHLGTFIDKGSLDSNPAVGALSFNISSLGLAHGTKITATVTYYPDAPPVITGIQRTGNNVTLTWSGGNGSGTSGFGVQHASTVTWP